MSTLMDLPRVQDLATQLELLKTQFATLRALHIAVVGQACILTTHLPANFKAPVVLSEELFTVVEAQLTRAISAMENDPNQFDGQPTEGRYEGGVRAVA
jgi:hypothetical protein